MSHVKSSLAEQTPERRKEIARAGGIASGIARRRASSLEELGQAMINGKPKKSDVKKILAMCPNLTEDDVTMKAKILYEQIKKAETGDTKSFEVVRDTIGEKPTDKIENLNSERKFSSIKFVDGDKTIELS